MIKARSASRNLIFQITYEVSSMLTTLVTSPYVARVLGAEQIGIYTYSYTAAYFFVLFALLGIKTYGARIIAQTRDDKRSLAKTFSSLAVLHLLVSCAFLLFYVFYVMVIQKWEIYAAIQLLYVLSGVLEVSWFYSGMEDFGIPAVVNTTIKIVGTIIIFVLVKSKSDLWIYCLILASTSFLSQAILWIPIKRYVRFERPSRHDIKQHIKPLFLLFIPCIAVSLYKYMDKIMISVLSSNTQLGLYENAEKITAVPLALVAAFGSVMLPKMAHQTTSGKSAANNKIISLSAKYVLCLAFSMAFGILAVADAFAPIFWGAEFVQSGKVMCGLAITIPFVSFANVLRTQFLLPNSMDKEYIVSVFWGVIVNFTLNWLLIPSRGAIGATIGTVFAEVAVCVLQIIYCKRYLPIKQYIASAAPFFFISSIMFYFLKMIGTKMGASIMTLILQILGGIIIFCVLSVVWLAVSHASELVSFIHRIRNRK